MGIRRYEHEMLGMDANGNELPNTESAMNDTTAATIKDRVAGKKLRIVFQSGRDLNIFDVQDFNVDGQWWRITDGKDRLYVVDPAKVNYRATAMWANVAVTREADGTPRT